MASICMDGKGGERKEMVNQRKAVLGLGIDIGKNKADVCLKENSHVLESFIVSNDENGIAALLARLDPYIKDDTFMIKAAMESTGNLWINMYGALEKEGMDISLANPLKTKAIAEAKIKSDKIDAAVLADLARADLVSRCYVPEMNVREMRSLVRHRIDLARRNTQLKNKVHNLLDKYSMKYDGKLFSKTGMTWLAFQQQNKLSMVDSQMVNSYVREIETINQIMADVEKQMATFAFNDKRVDLLLGFTGIDYYGALLIINEIGDIKRFSNPKKLTSWAGLAPSLHQSGNIRWTGRITRQGNRRIRWYMVQAAHAAIRYDPKQKSFYERISKKEGNQKAVVAVARKMLVSIYHVLTRNELYDGHRDDLKTRKVKRLESLTKARS